MNIRNIMAGMCCGLAIGALAAETAPLIIPEAPAPKLDGTLDDPAWQNALKIEQLYLETTDTPVRDTTVYMARDKKWLFLGFKCVNSNMAHVVQLVYNHDGAVQTDDSVEIFIRPEAAKKRCYHFMLNFANVRRDQRFTETGERDEGWNPPWRSMTKRLPDGWTAEMAIPLFILESDDLGGMQVNLFHSLVKVELDPYGAKKSEQMVYQMLKPDHRGSPHDFRNFVAVSGMGGFKPEIPFAPQITAAEAPGLRQKEGKYFYDVKLTLETASSVAGKAKVQVIEDLGAGEIEKLSELVDLDGKRELVLSVPAGELRERKVRIVLVDPTDGNMLAVRTIDDMSALSAIKKAFVGRSYYTSEEAAAIRLELGLPEDILNKAVLAIDVNGKKISEAKGLKPIMTPEIPLSALKIGENPVSLHIISDGNELAAQKITVNKLEPRPGFEVKADFVKGIILKDDKPFFPIGMFTAPLGGEVAAQEEIFKLLSDTGFNTVDRITGYTNIDMFMKLADKYRLTVRNLATPQPLPMSMLTPPRSPDLPLAERLKIQKEWYKKLEPGIIAETKTFREHRNLLSYYNVDEPNLVNPDERIACAEWYWNTVTPIDPYRPLMLLYARHIPRGDYWTKWGQIMGYDWYPGHPQEGGGFYSEPGLASAWFAYELRKRCRQDNKVMYFEPGANMLDPARTPIGMSKTHMLCQTYVAIIYGSRGLVYFGLSNIIGEEAWDALRVICAQLKELAPALLNGDIAQDIRYSPDNFKPEEQKFPMVNAAVYKYPDGNYLLLAANIIPYAVDTKFRIGGIKSVIRLFDKVQQNESSRKGAKAQRKLELKEESFVEKIEPYGVRAYTLQFDKASEPVQVALEMKALEDERAPNPDVQRIVRQVMMGKNHIPNPCFTQQTNKGVPDFYKPYFCVSIDPAAGKKGSTWYMDDEMPWNGNPSLRMYESPSGLKNRGTFGVWYPPVSDKPVKMTFSFYAKCDKAGGSLTFLYLFAGAGQQTIPLTTEWKRYNITGDVAPGGGGSRAMLFSGSRDSTVWISALQMEAGETATEFQDDSVIVKKKVIEDPGNLIKNGGAECGSAECWAGLENMRRGEIGVRRGVGHSGEYAFVGKGPDWIHSDLIEIDREKTYELKGFFKAIAQGSQSGENGTDVSGVAVAKPEDGVKSNALSAVLFGVSMFDAQKREMMCWNVKSLQGTMTELTVALVAGNRTLKVKDASAWRPGPFFCAAFGKKENELNFDVTPPGIAEIKQEGESWKIVLKEPCRMAFPAGTTVVENSAGGNGIFLPGAIANGNWTEIKGTLGPRQWWPGTKYVSIYIQPQRAGDGDAGALLIDDLSLRLDPNSGE